MVDKERVCCLCGDVGFPQKLFRCSRCRFRFQHSYCSNYYYGSEPKDNICDWCHFETGNKNPSSPSSKRPSPSSEGYHHPIRSQYTGSGAKINNHSTTVEIPDPKPSKNSRSPGPGPGPSRVPSPRPNGHRRYKLLKDVMC